MLPSSENCNRKLKIKQLVKLIDETSFYSARRFAKSRFKLISFYKRSASTTRSRGTSGKVHLRENNIAFQYDNGFTATGLTST